MLSDTQLLDQLLDDLFRVALLVLLPVLQLVLKVWLEGEGTVAQLLAHLQARVIVAEVGCVPVALKAFWERIVECYPLIELDR